MSLRSRLMHAAAKKRAQGGGQIYRDLVVSDTPKGYWRFEETSGTSIGDEMGAHNGTVNNASLTEAGFVSGSGSAVKFNGGANSQITIPTHVLPATGDTGACSFEFWFKTTSQAQEIIWDKRGDTGSSEAINRIFIALNRNSAGNAVPGHVCAFTRNSVSTQQLANTTALPGLYDGGRHHVVIVLHGNGTGAVYFDGQPKATSGAVETGQLHAASGTGRNGHLISGVDAGGFTTSAALDEVAVYRRALSAAEVLEHYNAGAA